MMSRKTFLEPQPDSVSYRVRKMDATFRGNHKNIYPSCNGYYLY